MNARFLLLAIGVASIGCATFPHWRMPHFHEVRPGETLAFIAEGYGVEPGWLASANGIRDASRLPVGTRLVIPGGGLILHTVRPGDTLATIAALYDVDASTIAQTNGVSAPDRITVGARLVMPRGARLPAREASPTAGTERPGRTPVATAPAPGVATPKRTASQAQPHATPRRAPSRAQPRATPRRAPSRAQPRATPGPIVPGPEPPLDAPARLLDDASEDYLAANFLAARDQAIRAGAALAGRSGREAARLRARAAFVEGSASAGLGEDARAIDAFARSRSLAPDYEPPAAWMSPRLEALYEPIRSDHAGKDVPDAPRIP
jgi:LysM repeat protein